MSSVESRHNRIIEEFVADRQGRIRQAGTVDPDRHAPDKLRLICERSLYHFCLFVLGRQYLTRSLHMPICNWLQKVPTWRKMLLLPRRHCKTSIVSHGLPLHIIVQSKGGLYMPEKPGCDMRVMMAGETETRATDNLRVVKNTLESNELFRGLWPHLVWDNPRKEADKWNEKMLVLPRNENYPDPTYRAIGVGGAITGARHDVHIKDDLVTEEAANSEVVMQGAIRWHTNSRALFDDQDKSLEFLIGCLPADTQITMRDGTKRSICDVVVGDSVWSPSADGSFECRKVEAVIPQGYAETWIIGTNSGEIEATGNHPFLVSKGKCKLEWVRADQLQAGDLVVGQKSTVRGVSVFDEDFVWLMGMMWGDGWVNSRERRGYVCFSPGVDEEQNQRVLTLLKKYVSANKWTLTKGGYYRCDTVGGAQKLVDLGLCAGAKKKRIPDWVYQEGLENRRAFLQGFIAADGSWVSNESYRVEICNKELLEDLVHLAKLCGVRPGQVLTRERWSQPPNSPEPFRSVSYSCSFNFGAVGRVEFSGSRNLTGWKNVGRDTRMDKNLRFVRIEKITKRSIQVPVWDLTVEGNPAFMANGLAVHNTRWAVQDLYSYVIENDPTVSTVVRSIVEDGKPIYPEAFTAETVERLRKEFGVMFALLYMNNVGDPDLIDFSEEELRFFSLVGNNCIFDEDVRDAQVEGLNEMMAARGDFHIERGERLTSKVLEEMAAQDGYWRTRS